MNKKVTKYTIIYVISFLVIFRTIFLFGNVPTLSMYPLIQGEDRILGYKFAYLNNEPERFDVVIFRNPFHKSILYIKRVIGLPGDTILISDNKVYINGELIDEPYVQKWEDKYPDYEITVPAGKYFVMGDNRDNSFDSRFWAAEAKHEGKEDPESYATINKRAIVAKYIYKFRIPFI